VNGVVVGAHADPSATASVRLLEQARDGDEAALNRLLQRYLPRLSRWASGRLPRWARDMSDTDDLVQDTLVRTVRAVPTFEHRGDGALQAYLRQAILNRVRDELRRHHRRPAAGSIQDDLPDTSHSPLEQAIGAETMDRYEKALQALTDEEREAVIARIELGCSYKEIAAALDKPSDDAARMAVSRALVSLARLMHHGQ
jgi:RNA polymerase sigma-70 factor (ECF subfamily)